MKHLTFMLALSLALPAAADAQEMQSVDIEYKTARQCPRVTTAGEATGVGASIFVGGLGAALIPFGAPTETQARSSGILAAGATLIALGAGGLVTSAIFLHRKRQKRAAYKRGHCEAPVAIIPGFRF